MRKAFWALVLLAVGTLPAMAQENSGFYIRGTLGAAFASNMIFEDAAGTFSGTELNGLPGQIAGHGGSSVIAGGGVGYKFSPVFWADLTLYDIPNLKFSAASNNIVDAFGDNDVSGGTMKISSVVALVNGYVDVARLLSLPAGSLQPYAMAGLGVARNHGSDFQFTLLGVVPTDVSHADRGNFAWTAGAGLGIPVTSSITLDIAYQYINLGNVITGNALSLPGALTPLPFSTAKADLQVHTVQLGLRVGF